MTSRLPPLWRASGSYYAFGCRSPGMTKYRKGPQRTTKEHYTGPQRIGNTAKDPQKTAKEHYGLSCRKLAPTELNGALYSRARQDFSHAAGLSWEPRLTQKSEPFLLTFWIEIMQAENFQYSKLQRSVSLSYVIVLKASVYAMSALSRAEAVNEEFVRISATTVEMRSATCFSSA